MKERANKFKSITKKEVSQMINQAEQTALTQNSKLSTNSQNKLFIRKPLTKRQGLGSPGFTKRIGIQNQSAKNRYMQQIPSKFPSQQCLSDRIFYQQKEKLSKLSNKISLKKNASSNQKNNKQTPIIRKSNAIKEAYFGQNEVHALTQIGETYRNDNNDEDNASENDPMFGWEHGRKRPDPNQLQAVQYIHEFTQAFKQYQLKILINAKKTTRTQYFQSPQQNQQIRSTTSRSRSQRQKQTNFNQLRKSLSTSEAYISSLQEKIRLLEKQTYTLTKKCKWMHEEMEMHLEKEHLMTAEIKGYENQLKGREKIISGLNGEKQSLSTTIEKTKGEIQKFKQNDRSKQAHLDRVRMPISNSKRKSLKEGAETISSLKQFCSRVQQKSVLRQSKIQQAFNGYYNNQACSIQRIKKPSFKTYPGVCSPKKRTSQINSKSSSIYELNPNESSFQDLGESSILTTNEKSLHQSVTLNNDNLLLIQKLQAQNEEIQKEKDILKQKIEEMKVEMQNLMNEHDEEIMVKNQFWEKKLQQKDQLIHKLNEDALQMFNQREQRDEKQKEQRNEEIKLLNAQFQNKLYTLSTRIKLLQSIQSQPHPGLHIVEQATPLTIPQPKDFQTENPLQYFLQQSQISCSQPSSSQSHLQQQNKSLRQYIEHLLSHYKYVKIQNRMLLKVKEDLTKMEKEKKQIKEERDLFKKKLLDFVKKKNLDAKSNKKNNKRRNMDFCDSSSSQDDQSTVFQLSQSEILHNDSDIKHNQDQILPNQLNEPYIQNDQNKKQQNYNHFKQN